MKAIHPIRTGLALATLLTLAACASSGMGGGELSRRGKAEEPVLFSWQSTDGGITGTMAATLPGATYQGRFFQITEQTQKLTIAPLWDGWEPGWRDWPYWGYGALGPYDVTQFVTRYTGKVVANLRSDAGKRMRCRLHLAAPARGMAGGGEGECQIQGGGVVHAGF